VAAAIAATSLHFPVISYASRIFCDLLSYAKRFAIGVQIMIKRLTAVAVVAVLSAAAGCTSMGEQQSAAAPASAPVVTAGNIVFPSGPTGSQTGVQQVEEVVRKANEQLAAQGLGIGNMLQHTIFVKDGALSPMQVLQAFHGTATKLAPSLKEFRSVGTIIRVPDFPDKNTTIMLDWVAGKSSPESYQRVPFVYGPQEIAESIGNDKLVFTAGLEAMDFKNGTLVPTIDQQMEVIVGKLDAALKNAGLGVGNMISHNLYVKKGTDPLHVIEKFHELTHRYAPELKDRPSVGTLVVVDGMAGDGFLLEMDAVAARPAVKGQPDNFNRVLFDDHSMPIARSVAVDDLVFLSGEEGMDNNGAISDDPLVQVEVAVKKLDATLRKSGLTLANLVKHRLFIKKGADAEQVRKKFHEVAEKLAPGLKNKPSAESVLIVEGLASDKMAFEVSAIAARRR